MPFCALRSVGAEGYRHPLSTPLSVHVHLQTMGTWGRWLEKIKNTYQPWFVVFADDKVCTIKFERILKNKKCSAYLGKNTSLQTKMLNKVCLIIPLKELLERFLIAEGNSLHTLILSWEKKLAWNDSPESFPPFDQNLKLTGIQHFQGQLNRTLPYGIPQFLDKTVQQRWQPSSFLDILYLPTHPLLLSS